MDSYKLIDKDSSNEIYTLIDETFLEMFPAIQRGILKSAYYSYYLTICEKKERKPLSKELFFTNMRRRRIRLYQLCCPYCGAISLLFCDNRDPHTMGFNYCSYCGRGSVEKIIFEQIARFIRVAATINTGIAVHKEKNPDEDIRYLGYDGYQMQIIVLCSIIEKFFKLFFDALFGMSLFSAKLDYMHKVISNYTKNDFMNIEKANEHYKKAFGINIRLVLEENTWNDLVDINNIRNMIVHNNGYIDARFETTRTYERLKSKVTGKLLFIDSEMIQQYIKSVIKSAETISEYFRGKYDEKKRTMIVMNYVLADK